MINDATNATVNPAAKTTVEVFTPDYIANNDPLAFQAANMVNRANQQGIIPSAVKGRNIALIQEFSNIDFKSGVVPNGSSIIITTTTTNAQGQLLENFPAYQIYVGNDFTSLRTPDNRMPEVVSSSSYPYYTKESLYDLSNVSVAKSDNRKGVHTLQVRNNSGVSKWIGAEIYTKFIVNNSNAASN